MSEENMDVSGGRGRERERERKHGWMCVCVCADTYVVHFEDALPLWIGPEQLGNVHVLSRDAADIRDLQHTHTHTHTHTHARTQSYTYSWVLG